MKTLTHNISALIIIAVVTISAFAIPAVSSAQCADEERKGISFCVKSPITAGTIGELIEAILGILIVIATPIVVLFIIYAGFLYVTAQGNAEQIKQATRALTYAIIDGVLVIGAVALAGIIEGVISAFRA